MVLFIFQSLEIQKLFSFVSTQPIDFVTLGQTRKIIAKESSAMVPALDEVGFQL
jgi:hypothetical protein